MYGMEGICSGFPKVPEIQGQNLSVDLVKLCFVTKKQANIPHFLVIGRHFILPE